MIVPVILSGGAGSRLWPLSREFYPKPLLPIAGDESLLQSTVRRLVDSDKYSTPLFVCNEEHRFLLAEQVRQAGVEGAPIILEPEGRNTAPALTLAALYLQRQGDENVAMAVMPADHLIPANDDFRKQVDAAVSLANKGSIVAFGVKPTYPETGYGYIEAGDVIQGDACKVASFKEKPDLNTAQGYVDSGNFSWNSGIFVVTAKQWLSEIRKFAPEIINHCAKALKGIHEDGDFVRVGVDEFKACPSDSIDYAVMERTENAAVLPMSIDWSDVGSWSSIWEVQSKDENGNVMIGDVIATGTKNSLFIAESRMIGAVEVDDIAVIETPDAVLVVPKSKSQEVKQIVARLKELERSEHKFHRKVYRPWGSYEGVDSGDRFQVKRLTVKPGASLSLQMHHHRAEHWIVVRGIAEVTKGEETFALHENESTFIPLGVTHRLSNPGKIELEIIEVQSGSYLGEDDIVRFEDAYNRC